MKFLTLTLVNSFVKKWIDFAFNNIGPKIEHIAWKQNCNNKK
jgi:hypothetical protein